MPGSKHTRRQLLAPLMDLLAGYGSGSESEEDNDAPSAATIRRPAAHPAPAVQSTTAAAQPGGLFAKSPGPNSTAGHALGLTGSSVGTSSLPAGFFDSSVDARAAADSVDTPAGLPAGFFDSSAASASVPNAVNPNDEALPDPAAAPPADLPQPSDQKLWKQLPAPRTAAAKRKVLFRPQINLELLAGSDSDGGDDEPAAKKAKPAAGAAGKPNILSFLPAPKNQPKAPKGLGAGTRLQTSDTNSTAAAPEQQPAAADAAPAAGAAMGNEAYRLVQPAPAAAEQYQQYQQYGQQQYPADGIAAAYSCEGYDYSSSAYDPATAAAATGTAIDTAAATALAPEEAFLQEALHAEASKAARRTAGAGSTQLMLPDIQFKEIKADKIKYVDPAQREAAQGMRAALGSDYAAKLRAQAAPHAGSKLARSKHQIGTLFANAKLRELEVLENRAAGMKSKAETAGKYGWR
eukprot:GHUV01001314.1.p1 GENE.GHUV01001314.1~~GHUV01001314.1.p1  ORF type:complete len:463 (+),score=202.93 GHUV01001314.1:513-1901(+)